MTIGKYLIPVEKEDAHVSICLATHWSHELGNMLTPPGAPHPPATLDYHFLSVQ